MWVAGPVVFSGLFGCSLQDFDYLTRDRSNVDAASAGAADAKADDGSAPDGATAVKDAGAADSAEVAAADAAEAGPVVVDGGLVTEAGGGTSTLINAGFEQGYLGWTFTPASAMGKYAYTQYAPTGGTTIDGQYELATWSQTDSFTVRVSQALANLPDGTYAFAGHFNCGVNNAAYVYNKNCGGPDQQANIPVTSPTGWESIGLTIAVSGGSCEVGFYVDASPEDWLNTDAFSFALVGPAADDAGGE